MKILIADKFEEWGVEALQQSGFDVVQAPGLVDDALRAAIAESACNVLIVRGTKVTADMIESSVDLSLIVRAGAGYNTIDVEAASRFGVMVANCPGKNAVAVAELTFALILALDRRLVENVVDLRNGVWNKKEYSKARGLKDRTLGIIGTGEIGRAVARRARGFEMDVVAWSRSLTDDLAEELGVTRCAGPGEVAERCDILSLHVAAAPETRGMIGADVLNRLKPGSFIVNTSRAEVLDHAALAAAVKERGLRVGLDVFPGEPSGGTAEFRSAIVDGGGVVYGTHHIGASTDQAQNAIAEETVRVVREYAAAGRAPNCVNIETRSPACCQLVVRHYDRVGVLAAVLDLLSRANLNVEEMSNTIFQGAHAAVAVIRLTQMPDDAVVRAIADMRETIISIEVKPV